jgi:tetratricopeptide (TPR) repeat protein
MQEVNQTIVKLTKAVESLRALHDELQNCSAEERAAKIEATRKICPVSLEISLEETGTTLQKKIYNLESRLKNVRHYRDLLSSSAPRGTLKTYGLGDKEIVDLTLPQTLKEIAADWSAYRDSVGGVLQRIYFETQGGPTRRAGRKPGDELVKVIDLNGPLQSIMFLNLCKNLKAFYESLTPEEQKDQQQLFESLFEKLERARPLFFMASLTAHTKKEPLLSSVCAKTEPGNAFMDVARNAYHQVQELKEGDSILLPGGSAEHAIACEIKRQKNGNVTLTLYNSDPRLTKLHREVGGKYSNIRVRNIDPEKLNEPFFSEFFGKMASVGMGDLYRLLQSLGTAEPDSSYHYEQGDVGSCTYQCLLRWLKDQMGQPLYHRVREHNLKALLADYANHFSGQVREDGTVRVFTWFAEVEVAGGVIEKLARYANRALQKIGRGIFIEQEIDRYCRLPSADKRLTALNAIAESDEVLKTVLNEQDRCLILMKIGARLAEHTPPFNQEAQFFFDKAVREAEEIEDPGQQATTLHDIAQTLFLHGREEAGLTALDRSARVADRIEDLRQRASAFFDIAMAFLSQKRLGEVVKYIDKARGGTPLGPELLGREKMRLLGEFCDDRIWEHDFETVVRILNLMAPSLERDNIGSFLLQELEGEGELDFENPVLKSITDPMVFVPYFYLTIHRLRGQGEYRKAIELAERFPVVDYRAHALMQIADELFVKDPDEARRVLDRAIVAVRSVPASLKRASMWDRYSRWSLFLDLVKILALKWKEKGKEGLMDEALEAVEGITDLEERDKALHAIAETFLELDLPERAEEIEKRR